MQYEIQGWSGSYQQILQAIQQLQSGQQTLLTVAEGAHQTESAESSTVDPTITDVDQTGDAPAPGSTSPDDIPTQASRTETPRTFNINTLVSPRKCEPTCNCKCHV